MSILWSPMVEDLAQTAQKAKGLDPSGIPSTSDKYFSNNQTDLSALEQILSSRGSQWADLVSSNPYKNIQYRQSWWQKFMSDIGFRTKYDQAMEQADLQSREYLNALAQKAQMEDYELPSAEAQRMRDAGMNPDLLGTEGVNGAQPLADDGNYMSPDTFSPDASLGDVVNFISQGVSMAFGMAKDMQALKAGRLAIQSQDAGLASQMRDITMQAILDLAPPESLRLDKDTGKLLDWTDGITDKMIKGYGKNKGLHGVNLKTFRKSFANMMNGLSASNERYDLWYKKANNRQGYLRKFGSEYYGQGVEDEAMMKLNEGLIWLSDKIEDLKKNADMSGEESRMYSNQNESTYQASMQELGVPELQAENESLSEQSENSSKKMEYYQNKVKEFVNEMMDNIMNQWKDMAYKDGDEWAINLLYAFGMLKLVNTVGSESGIGSVSRGIGKLLDMVF